MIDSKILLLSEVKDFIADNTKDSDSRIAVYIQENYIKHRRGVGVIHDIEQMDKVSKKSTVNSRVVTLENGSKVYFLEHDEELRGMQPDHLIVDSTYLNSEHLRRSKNIAVVVR